MVEISCVCCGDSGMVITDPENWLDWSWCVHCREPEDVSLSAACSYGLACPDAAESYTLLQSALEQRISENVAQLVEMINRIVRDGKTP